MQYVSQDLDYMVTQISQYKYDSSIMYATKWQTQTKSNIFS